MVRIAAVRQQAADEVEEIPGVDHAEHHAGGCGAQRGPELSRASKIPKTWGRR